MKAIERSYPNSTNYTIAEVFKPKQGWVGIWGMHLVKLTRPNVLKAQSEGATHINVRLIDEFGVERYPDFTVEELLHDKTL